MARPRKVLTTAQVAQLEKLAACMTLEQIADFFGLGERTLRQRLSEDATVSAAYKRGRAHAINIATESLMALVKKKNLGAICFYLKTQAGWRETSRTEVTGADGDAIQVHEVSTNELRDRFTRRITGIAARTGADGGHSGVNGNGARRP